jgi:dTDP-4-amino-4,6-dideoxygalactose transaminase
VIPRNRLDVGWSDLIQGALGCARLPDRASLQARVERHWMPDGRGLASLSVRSGFDEVLGVLAFPPGTEILVSAITIRDVVRIIGHHGLRAVPVDVDPDTLAVRPDALAAAVTPATRAMVIAHLFGARTDLAPVVAVAQQHGLFLFEDCAQGFRADRWRGHPDADVALFSFGPIKTATALGGALLTFRDAGLCARVRSAQRCRPVQRRRAFLWRVSKYALLHALTWRPAYALFTQCCRAFGTTHDRVISGAVRGFAGGDLLAQLRQQPSVPLLALLERRLRSYPPDRVAHRKASGDQVARMLRGSPRPGSRAAAHTHWVFPVTSDAPDALVAHLWQHGFDATRGASSMGAVPASTGAPSPDAAISLMERIVYLPSPERLSAREAERLVAAVTAFVAPAAGDETAAPGPIRTAR